MTAMRLLGDRGGMIAITVQGYQYRDATEYYDANWLNCRIEVAAGALSSSYRATLTVPDFTRFHGELVAIVDSLEGTAVFGCMEPWIEFTVAMGARGSATVKGKADSDLRQRTILSFEFTTDQSYLQQTLVDLKQLVTAFPERGTR